MKKFRLGGRYQRHVQKGVTLIMVAGVLSILAAMGAGFYTLTISQSKSAMRYSESVRADMMARAGMSDAIARLQEQAFYKTEDPTDGWYQIDWLHAARRHVSYPAKNIPTASGKTEQYASFSRSLGNSAGDKSSSDRFSLDIADTSGRINVNAGDNLGVLLDNLCRVIGPPLVAANLDALQPRRWALEGAPKNFYDNSYNKDDNDAHLDLYSRLDSSKHQLAGPDGSALYGDGYAIAAFRGRNGKFARLEDVRLAVSTVFHPNHPELEELERSVKFNALREYITIDSWVDTTTVCVGKFEFAESYRCIDRDKSWIASVDIDTGKNKEDGLNERGSLVGCYLSIINGHGAGQLRRIKKNGIDWLETDEPFAIPPGPTSSYMIISREDCKLDNSDSKKVYPDIDLKGNITLTADGHLTDDQNIDYKHRPLCIHRAPININTASDKVLIAMFMGINVQHGTPLAIGTDADERKITDRKNPSTSWIQEDTLKLFSSLPTQTGLKRIPQNSGKPMLNCRDPWTDSANFGYINNYGSLTPPNFLAGGGTCNEAHQLAYRVIMARQPQQDPVTGLPKKNDFDPNVKSFKAPRGPFKSWDDFFFRVVQPWDDDRINYGPTDALGNPVRISLAPMIMAHFNSNTDILKFNPNIEWIDRWGRNFTSMEPVITGKGFNGTGPMMPGNSLPEIVTGLSAGPIPAGSADKPDPEVLAKGHGAVSNASPIEDHKFYYIRNVRYKFDEMIDKSDMNRSTTEFTMDAGGMYEIHSVGQVVLGGEVRSERKLEALVQVYDVWRESTQRQFVEGTFSTANRKNLNGANKSGLTDAGKITRDATNGFNGKLEYKSLDTLPEPLVPLKYRFQNPNPYGGAMVEYVDNDPRDAVGNTRQPWSSIGGGDKYTIPDVIANKILPAGFDGQLVLASNTLVFDPGNDNSGPSYDGIPTKKRAGGDGSASAPGNHDDTFLASFNGDLDTDTCLGNGREQAKTPQNCQYRVCDTISLLGLLNDHEIDLDSDSVEDINVVGGNPKMTTLVSNGNGTATLKTVTASKINPIFLLNFSAGNSSASLNAFPKNPQAMRYEYCMSCRVGDLRPDGVYLGALGVSCKDATLKYAIGQGQVGNNDSKVAAVGHGLLIQMNTGNYVPPTNQHVGNISRGGGASQANAGGSGMECKWILPFVGGGANSGFNYLPGHNNGCTVSMWVKSTWDIMDNQEHEFFNGSSNGSGSGARCAKLCKQGFVRRVVDPSTNDPKNPFWDGAEFYNSTFWTGLEDYYDNGAFVGLHGGQANLPAANLSTKAKNQSAETPSYYVQPFRWAYLGEVHKMGKTVPKSGDMKGVTEKQGGHGLVSLGIVYGPAVQGEYYDDFYVWESFDGASGGGSGQKFVGMDFIETFGFWEKNLGYSTDGTTPGDNGKAQLAVDSVARNILRPFISTARFPEGKKFRTDNMSVISTMYPYLYGITLNPYTSNQDGKQPYGVPPPTALVGVNGVFNGVVDIGISGPAMANGIVWLGSETVGTDPKQIRGWMKNVNKANTDLDCQPAAYRWAQSNNKERSLEACFSINNTNQGFAPFYVPPPPPPPPPRPVGPPYPYYPPGPGVPRPPPPPPPIPRPGRPRSVPGGAHKKAEDDPIPEPSTTVDEVGAIDAPPLSCINEEKDKANFTVIGNGATTPPLNVDGGVKGAPVPAPAPVAAPQPVPDGGTTGRGTTFTHIYKLQPCDTTMCVIDELRISKKAWSTLEIQDEMTLSRYYLPKDTSRGSTHLPRFVSQSLIQSLEGTTVKSDDKVAIARVSWNVFTPRFMHEYKVPDQYQRNEVVHGVKTKTFFRGPFDYSQYNWDINADAGNGWKHASVNPRNPYLCVDRVPPAFGTQSPWSRGVTVDLIELPVSSSASSAQQGFTIQAIQGYVMDRITNVPAKVTTFADPEAENCYINPGNPGQRRLVKAGELHYRVTFEYPVDQKRIDPKAKLDTVDPNTQYLLDTPVFDDISIVYIQAPKILYFKEAVE